MKIWTEISEPRLRANFAALQRLLAEGQDSECEPTSLLAVVKANAYGHGIEQCAPILAAAGAGWLGVTDAQEGARVREVLAALPPTDQPEILVMSGMTCLPGEADCIVRHDLTAVVWTAEHVLSLGKARLTAGVARPVRVHLEVDSGMSRQGATNGEDLGSVLRAIAEEPRLTLDGVFTHFASTEVAGSAQTAAQQEEFAKAIAQVAASGLRPRWVHVGNSSYIDNGDGESLAWLRTVAGSVGARSMVRSGLALYGYLLPIEGPGRSLARESVQPVMTWKTRVIGIRDVPSGALVGYDGAFSVKNPKRLALLPAGYADGLRRELSSTNAKAGGWVLIQGKPAPIVGRVSMNLTTVDVTGIAGVAEGNEVVLLGEGVSAEDHARVAGTIAYEILCGVKIRA